MGRVVCACWNCIPNNTKRGCVRPMFRRARAVVRGRARRSLASPAPSGVQGRSRSRSRTTVPRSTAVSLQRPGPTRCQASAAAVLGSLPFGGRINQPSSCIFAPTADISGQCRAIARTKIPYGTMATLVPGRTWTMPQSTTWMDLASRSTAIRPPP